MKVYLISILTVTFFLLHIFKRGNLCTQKQNKIKVSKNIKQCTETPGLQRKKRTWVLMSNIWLLVNTGNLKKTKELSV